MTNRSRTASAACLLIFTLCFSVYAVEPEEVLRNLPAPQVNYPLEEIRIKNETPPDSAVIVSPVNPPPPAPPEEIKRLARKAVETSKLPFIKSARKLIDILSKPVVLATNTPAVTLATSVPKVATSSIKLAAKPVTRVVATSTRVISAFKTLSENSEIARIRANIDSEVAFASDLFNLFLNDAQNVAQPEEPTQDEAKFDSVFVSAQAMKQRQKWPELKRLFEDNPEAGETADGLRFQIEAEIYSSKPNYMTAQRFANQLKKAEADDPLADFATALFYYHSKKPNLDKAKQALEKALKAPKVPEGASTLYWQIMGKKFMIPLLLLVAGVFAGISLFIRKRKTAITLDGYEQYDPVTEAETNTNLAKSAAFFKNILASLVGRLKKQKPETETTEVSEGYAEPHSLKQSNEKTAEDLVDTVDSPDTEEENEEDEDMRELEGEDSKLIMAGDDEDSPEEDEDVEYEEIEIIEEIEIEEEIEEKP